MYLCAFISLRFRLIQIDLKFTARDKSGYLIPYNNTLTGSASLYFICSEQAVEISSVTAIDNRSRQHPSPRTMNLLSASSYRLYYYRHTVFKAAAPTTVILLDDDDDDDNNNNNSLCHTQFMLLVDGFHRRSPSSNPGHDNWDLWST
jgi:hypothetical protein